MEEMIKEGVAQRPVLINSSSQGVLYIICLVALGWIIYKSGYNSGADVSKKLLKQHSKDVSKMEKKAAKKEKQIRKELTL